MKHECERCGHDFARDPQPTHHCDPVAVRERTVDAIARFVMAYDDSGDDPMAALASDIRANKWASMR